jgi:hypothetical protein
VIVMAKTVIRCKLERDGGTRASIGDTTYHFRPQPNLGAATAHVCEVAEKAHVNRFLAITEGYELFLGEDEVDAPVDVAPAVPDDEPVAPEPEPDPEPAPEPAAPADAPDAGDGAEVDVRAPLDEQSTDTLHAIYRALNHDHPAPGNIRRSTLIKKIEEIREAQG